MDFLTVLSRLENLPSTFLRDDNTFGAWENSQAFQLSEYTQGVDALALQANFSNSSGNWVDVWGELFGIPRNNNEATSTYKTRISTILQFPISTVFAVEQYSSTFWGQPITVTESTSGVGYTILLPSNIDTSQINTYLDNLAKVRPAGVPFLVSQNLETSFLNTISYVGSPGWGGAYLGGYSKPVSNQIPQPTINSQPILPTYLLSDPILNGTVVA